MNTVSWGPESSPTLPHRTHDSLRSLVDHHVERGTNVVARSARSCDWERLSGSRQFPCKDPLATIPEDLLLSIASICARNSRMQSCTLGSDIERLSPGTEGRVEASKTHQPNGGSSVQSSETVI